MQESLNQVWSGGEAALAALLAETQQAHHAHEQEVGDDGMWASWYASRLSRFLGLASDDLALLLTRASELYPSRAGHQQPWQEWYAHFIATRPSFSLYGFVPNDDEFYGQAGPGMPPLRGGRSGKAGA